MDFENVNLTFLMSKDGRFSWRPMQIIHPVIYLSLVNRLTEPKNWVLIQKFFSAEARLKIIRPVGQILAAARERSGAAAAIMNWRQKIEQESLMLSLDYRVMAETDIELYYESIRFGDLKREFLNSGIRGMGLLGEEIMTSLQAGLQGTTQGLPQGSVVMDFLAEMLLLGVDLRLEARLRQENLLDKIKILRFRDDYRIFAEDIPTAEGVVGLISEALAEFSLHLSTKKTRFYNDVIAVARKEDKAYWDERRATVFLDRNGEPREMSLQKQLFRIYELAREFPNSGSVCRALMDLFEKRILKLEEKPRDNLQLIAIVAKIFLENPRAGMVAAGILSRLLDFEKLAGRRQLLEKLAGQVRKLSHNEYLEICLQRLTILELPELPFSGKLARFMAGEDVRLWNSDWLDAEFNEESVINHRALTRLSPVMTAEEVRVFENYEMFTGI